jgi:hypothetical protein
MSNTFSDIKLRAIEKVKDQDILKNLALNSTSWKIRRRATMKITDDGALTHIALNDPSNHVRRAAANNFNLDDEKSLIELFLNDSSNQVRNVALRRINDEELLLEMYNLNLDEKVRRIAIQNPNFPLDELVKIISTHDPSSAIWKSALFNPRLPADVLARHLVDAEYFYWIRFLINRINDYDLLVEAIENIKFRWQSCEVIQAIKNEAFLERMINENSDRDTRKCLVLNPNLSSEILEDIVLNDSHDSLRCLALKNPNIPDAILKHFLKEGDDEFRDYAFCNPKVSVNDLLDIYPADSWYCRNHLFDPDVSTETFVELTCANLDIIEKRFG